MRNNPLREKSFQFAINASKICIESRKIHKEYDLTRQLIRSSTSIGANVEEAMGGQSKRDFYHKLTISYKEGRESEYWIRILSELQLIEKGAAKDLSKDIRELNKILASILATMRKKYNFNFN